MAWLLLLPPALLFAAVVLLPFLHGDAETDARLSRVDLQIDRENAGWRNTR